MASRSVTPLHVLVAAVIRLLAERPRSVEELAEGLVGEGLRLGPDPVEYVEDLFDEADELHQVVSLVDDERLFWPPALLSGAVFTHVVTESEVVHDLLLATPDLLPLGLLMSPDRDAVRVADGSELHTAMVGLDDDLLARRGVPVGVVDDYAWLLTPGWFTGAGIADGDTIVVDVVEGRVRISRAKAAPFDELRAVRARALVHDLAVDTDAAGAHEIDVLVASAIAAEPTLFTEPLPPLGELFEHGGFTIQGDYLCPPGVDLRAQRNAARVQRIVAVHSLAQDEAETVIVLTDLVSTTRALQDSLLGGGGVPDGLVDVLIEAVTSDEQAPVAPARPRGRLTVRSALDRLAVPEVAAAAAVEVLGLRVVDASALELTAELLEPMVSRQARPAVRWLRAKAQERAGRVLDAEASLEAAYSLDPQWAPVLADLARFASDRGDVERGISLLHRAGVDTDDRLLRLLEDNRPPDRSDLGRNDPCWCGSGRRYKACHRGRERLDLPARASWLYNKAWMHLVDGPGRILHLEVAQTWAGDHDPRRLVEAFGEDVVIDLTLFEGGVFADFLTTRGVLLPDDERLLAEQWLLVERSVHEVESVRRDRGFTARDIRTGDRHEVSERLATRQMTVGDLLLMRLVPDGRDTVIFGGIETVDLARRESLVALLDSEPEPVPLVEFIAAMHAPPTMLNADGGELVICQARLRLPDPDAVAAWLDVRLVRDDDDVMTRTWHERVDSAGGSSIRASVTLEDDELVLFTMSEERFDALLDALREARPEVEILEQERRTTDDLTESGTLGSGAGSMIDPRGADPELAAALADYVRGYEQRWLDESIPALGGVTPREAAADPTRRDDLVRLLDSFPDDHGDPGQMSATRLRANLGLA